MWWCTFKSKLMKSKTSVTQLPQPHVKCSIATWGQWLLYWTTLMKISIFTSSSMAQPRPEMFFPLNSSNALLTQRSTYFHLCLAVRKLYYSLSLERLCVLLPPYLQNRYFWPMVKEFQHVACGLCLPHLECLPLLQRFENVNSIFQSLLKPELWI